MNIMIGTWPLIGIIVLVLTAGVGAFKVAHIDTETPSVGGRTRRNRKMSRRVK